MGLKEFWYSFLAEWNKEKPLNYTGKPIENEHVKITHETGKGFYVSFTVSRKLIHETCIYSMYIKNAVIDNDFGIIKGIYMGEPTDNNLETNKTYTWQSTRGFCIIENQYSFSHREEPIVVLGKQINKKVKLLCVNYTPKTGIKINIIEE